MKKITRYDQLFKTQEAPESQNVLWLEKRDEVTSSNTEDQNAFNLYVHNNGEWRNILAEMWDLKSRVETLEQQVAVLQSYHTATS